MHKVKLLACKRVGDYVSSFLSEGYILQVQSKSISLMFAKLKHQHNGNEIIIKCDLKNIIIYKNKKIIKHETCNCN